MIIVGVNLTQKLLSAYLLGSHLNKKGITVIHMSFYNSMGVLFFEGQPYYKSEISNETASHELQSWNTDTFIQNNISSHA